MARHPAARWLSVGTELDPGPMAPRVARAFLHDVLDVWDCDDEDAVAAILTSEVVTNAVRYAASRVELRLTLSGDVLRVEARDDGPGSPRVLPVDPDATSGRGLFLVEALARAWGTKSDGDGGKVVWFELPVHRRRRRPVSAAETDGASRSGPPPRRRSPPGTPPAAP